MKVPVKMPTSKPSKEQLIEQIKHSPEFAQLKVAKLKDLEFPKDKIPLLFYIYLHRALMQFSIASLNLPSPIYRKFILDKPETYSFLELQKAVDIVWNSKPTNEGNGMVYAEMLIEYANMIENVNEMRIEFEKIIIPIQDAIIDELVKKKAPSIIQ